MSVPLNETKFPEQSPPMYWLPCSPRLLSSGVDCSNAPRWSAGPIGQHWHPCNASALASILHKQLIEALRVRADFDKAELLDDVNFLDEILFASEQCGRKAYTEGVPYSGIPRLFSSKKMLEIHWQEGWIDAENTAEKLDCPRCQSVDGQLCSHHQI